MLGAELGLMIVYRLLALFVAGMMAVVVWRERDCRQQLFAALVFVPLYVRRMGNRKLIVDGAVLGVLNSVGLILQVIGQGGFGTVFKAFDEKLHRMVAIKVLSPAYATNGAARGRRRGKSCW